MEQLLEQFEQMLGSQPGLDPDARKQLGQQFSDALRQATPAGEYELPSRESLVSDVEALREHGGMSDDDANAMVRRLSDALEPLQRRESQLAIEFSRRMQADGEAAALEWFREATRGGAEDQQDQAAGSFLDSGPVLKTEAIHSRARRPRGPPARRG